LARLPDGEPAGPGLEELGILEEITGRKRSRIYRYEPYVSLFDDAPVSTERGLATPPPRPRIGR
jgi:hypothetical protein